MQKSKLVRFRFTPELSRRLRRVSRKSKASVNELVLEAIEASLENLEEMHLGLSVGTYPRKSKGHTAPDYLGGVK